MIIRQASVGFFKSGGKQFGSINEPQVEIVGWHLDVIRVNEAEIIIGLIVIDLPKENKTWSPWQQPLDIGTVERFLGQRR